MQTRRSRCFNSSLHFSFNRGLTLFAKAAMRSAAFFSMAMVACAPTQVAQRSVDRPPQETPPSITATPPRLVKAPKLAQLAAYACSLGVSDSAERQDCLTAFGPPPPYSDLNFQFGTALTVRNHRDTLLTLSSLRILLKFFAGEKEEAVGTLCLRMCAVGDAHCTGSVAPDGCDSNEPAVRRVEAVIAKGIPGLFIGPTAATVAVELRKSTAAPNEELKLDLVFDMGSDQMLQVLVPALKKQMKSKSPPELKEFQLPVSLEGGVFVRSVDPARLPQRIGTWLGPIPSLLAL